VRPSPDGERSSCSDARGASQADRGRTRPRAAGRQPPRVGAPARVEPTAAPDETMIVAGPQVGQVRTSGPRCHLAGAMREVKGRPVRAERSEPRSGALDLHAERRLRNPRVRSNHA
jgi:hypothetical protein